MKPKAWFESRAPGEGQTNKPIAGAAKPCVRRAPGEGQTNKPIAGAAKPCVRRAPGEGQTNKPIAGAAKPCVRRAPGEGQTKGDKHMTVMRLLMVVGALLLALPQGAWAYSYAAAGKEPLIDGREAMLAAAQAKDWAAAAKALGEVKTEVEYLVQHHDAGLAKALSDAIDKKDQTALAAALRRAFASEIERRLDGARQNMNDYQTAKVLVVKSKRFFDAMSAELPADQRSAADTGLSQALAAIGNPGVFGAGRKPADPAAFDTARKAALTALGR